MTRPVIGVDGARNGWVGVVWDGAVAEPVFGTTLAEVCDRAGDVEAVAVDIPIGLTADGRRPCDEAARPLLGPRRSSLFAPPALGALDHDDYAGANAWSKAVLGRGIAKQAWMLKPKILEARALADIAPVPLHEAFPELAFRAMNGDAPMRHPKRTWTGMRARLDLLDVHGVHVAADVGPAGGVAADDMIDAAALAWSAKRIADGRAEHLPVPLVDGPSIWW